MLIDYLTKQLRRDEGEVLYGYEDNLGYLTIGVGRLIDKRKGGGISPDESAYLLANDIKRISAEVDDRLPWVITLDDARRGVLLNMAFQIGVTGLIGFASTLAFAKAKLFDQAADAMLDSKWAIQTPIRARRLAMQMRTGVWQ